MAVASNELNCDGVDDDCDGKIDEGWSTTRPDAAKCIGDCRTRAKCQNGAVVCGAPLAEVPNDAANKDEDCTGAVNDEVSQVSCTDNVDNDVDGVLGCLDATCDSVPACTLTAGAACAKDADCQVGLVCVNSQCRLGSCDDGIRSAKETGLDCGGPCAACNGLSCEHSCRIGEPATPSALATLRFAHGVFTRSTTATYDAGLGVLQTARVDELRWVDGGEGRMALFEGATTNLFKHSSALEQTSVWVAPNANPMTIAANAETAPDGTLTAERLSFPNGPARSPRQQGQFSQVAKTVSFYARGLGAFDEGKARAMVTSGAPETLLAVTTSPVGLDWQRIDLAVTAPSAASVSGVFGLTHNAGWPDASQPALQTSPLAMWGAQLEARPFPTSYVPSGATQGQRAADSLIVEAGNVPAWLRNEIWQVDVQPLFSSAELIPAVANDSVVYRHTLLSFGTTEVYFTNFQGGSAYLIATSGDTMLFASPALSWQRGDTLRLTFDLTANRRSVTISGAEKGDGTYGAAMLALPAGRLRIGGRLDGGGEIFAALSELRKVSGPTDVCTTDASCSCGNGVLNAGEECDPGLDVHCSDECYPTSWVDECPNCRNGQACPAKPNGAAFGLDPSLLICVPTKLDCTQACGDSYDDPCGKCIKQPDCSAAKCGEYVLDGTGNVCTGVCAPGEVGCLLESDCRDGTHCIQNAEGVSACSPPLTIGDLAGGYTEPRKDFDGQVCYRGPLCLGCFASCDGTCNLAGECAEDGPACPPECEQGCDLQGQCIQGDLPKWPLGESVLPSDVVPPPEGALSVSDSGVATYTIPLTLPDGPSGHKPELSFVYNSTAGDGVLGRGWSLGGMSAISVCEPDDRGTSIYRGGPSLCLDGEPLLVKQLLRDQNGGASPAHFTGLFDGGYVVKGTWDLAYTDNPFPSAGGDDDSHAWVPGREFTVHHEDGRTLYFGHATDDDFLLRGGNDPAMGPSNIRQWLLRRMTDRFGNAIDYRYQKARVTVRAPEIYDPSTRRYLRNANSKPVERREDAEAILRWIGYNGGSAEVAFHYVGDEKQNDCSDARDPYCKVATDMQLGRWHGGPMGRAMVLRRVDVRMSSRLVRSYGMGYELTEEGSIHLLKTLQECGFAQGKRSCAPPLEFDYGDPNAGPEAENAKLLRQYLTYHAEPHVIDRYTRPNTVVLDVDGDGQDDVGAFNRNGTFVYTTDYTKRWQYPRFSGAGDGDEFPTFFHYKPKEQKEKFWQRISRKLLVPVTFGGLSMVRWGEESLDVVDLPSDVVPTDFNRDGLTDLVVWGVDPTQHIKDAEGSLDRCDKTELCGSRERRHRFKATYPLGVWVYLASMEDGKLNYSIRRILHEGFAGEEPGLAAKLPGIEGRDYRGIRVNNEGPKWRTNAAFATFDYNDDGQLDFLYCSNHQGGNGILIESGAGFVHQDVRDLLSAQAATPQDDYKSTVLPGLPLDFCFDAQALRTRQGRTDVWSPTTRLVLTSTPAGPAVFKETTFGDRDFHDIEVRQLERNGDGLPDLVLHKAGTENLEFWLNTGTGFVEGHALGFQPANTVKSCDYKYLVHAAVADIDGNGIDDLVTPGCHGGADGKPGALVAHYMHPGARVSQVIVDVLGENKAEPGTMPYALWPGDFDGDGDTDFRFVSAQWSGSDWYYSIGTLDNTTFTEFTSRNMLTRVHATAVPGKRGTETFISYVGGTGYLLEGEHYEGDLGDPPRNRGELHDNCDPNQDRFDEHDDWSSVAGEAKPDPGRGGERAGIYTRTATAGACPLGGLATCAPRLPYPVVASYVERTANLTAEESDYPRIYGSDCTKTQMFYENGKQDSHQGFVGFERVVRRNMVPEALRSVEGTEYDLSMVPLPRDHVARTGESLDGASHAIVSRLYTRPFAGMPRTQWVDETMPSGATRTTETDYSRALLRAGDDPTSAVYSESRLPQLRAISTAGGDFWGSGKTLPVADAPLTVVPVLRQDRVTENKQVLNTTATWWLRNGSGFVDNELSLSSRSSTVQDLVSTISGFASSSSRGASGDLDHEAMSSWFTNRHDMSAVGARIRKQASPDPATRTWDQRIGLFALAKSEKATTWARPLDDGRQDVRRLSQSFSYESNGALRSTSTDNGDGSSYTYTITERASTGAVKQAAESAVDEWSVASDSKTWSFELDEYGLYTVAITNPYGHVSRTRYDYASGQPVRVEDADGVVTLATYDAFGRVLSETVQNAATTVSYAWTSADPVKVALPGNPTGFNELPVNAAYRMVETTTRGALTEVSGETWFDPAGRVVRSGTRGPLGTMVWTDRAYDNRSRLFAVSRPHANQVNSTQGAIVYAYDSLDRPTRVTRPNDAMDGTRWSEVQYGSIGDPGDLGNWLVGARSIRAIRQLTSDGQRAALVRTFDSDGRLVSSREKYASEAAEPTTAYQFGLGGPMAITGPDGATILTNYDSLGRAKLTIDPSTGMSTWKYDGFGRLREENDNSTKHRIDYDLLDRPLVHARSYAGADRAFGADKKTFWSWDALPGQTPQPRNRGKLLRISDTAGFAEDYTYGGPFALRDSATRTVPRPLGQAALSMETRYEHDEDGRLTVLRHPGGQRAQTFRYDERGALKGIDATMNGAASTIWELTDVYAGYLPKEIKLLGGKQKRAYYPGTGALQRLSTKAGDTPLVDETMRYNESGLLEEHTDVLANKTESFFYDRFRRLEERREGAGRAGTLLESFKFSGGGRIDKKTDSELSYQIAGQPVRFPDAVKRLKRGTDTLDYGYHGYGLMTSIQGTWQGTNVGLGIKYDVDRQVREVKWQSGLTRTLGYSPTGDRASVYETGGEVDSFVAYAGPHYERAEVAGNVVEVFRFADGEGNVIAEERVEQQILPEGTTLEIGVGLQHLARNYQGSVAAILPSGGEVTRRTYEAFGAAVAGASTDLGYTGHRHLQTDDSPLGLIDMGGRMFDPLSAQFTRADPFMPGADTPKGFNRFAYVQGDPVNFVDPTGFKADCNPSTGECQDPTQDPLPPVTSGQSGGRVCKFRCQQRFQKAGDFFKTITGVNAIEKRQQRNARERRYREGRFVLQGGGNAPNTSPGIVDQVINAIDRHHLQALNATAEAITGAGDFVTFHGSEWVRNKLFGEGSVRTDTAASYVGAAGGFVISGGVRMVMAIPSAVRAVPGVIASIPGAIRSAPGALMAIGRGVVNILQQGRLAAEAAKLQARAQQLNALRGQWQAQNGTTAVMRAIHNTTGEVATFVATNLKKAEPALRAAVEAGGERFIQGVGHAEETIIRALGSEWTIMAGGTSRNVCLVSCAWVLGEAGLGLGGQTFRGMADKTLFRMFWRAL